MRNELLKKVNRLRNVVLLISLIMLLVSGTAHAGVLPRIKDVDYVIDEDSTINLPGNLSYMSGAIDLNGNYEVTTLNNPVITIELAAPGYNWDTPHYGIIVQNKGRVIVDKVIINGHGTTDFYTSGLRADHEDSYIKIGDYSEIDVSSGGIAVYASREGVIDIGNYAKLYGNTTGAGTVYSQNSGIINIGNDATITNVGYLNRMGIMAHDAGIVNVGDNLRIEVLEDVALNMGIVAGISGYNGIGIVSIGDGATITVRGVDRAYGLYSWYDGSSITVGNNTSIRVEATVGTYGSAGVVAAEGSIISLGSGSSIEIVGNSVSGVYSSGGTFKASITLGANNSVTTTGRGSHALVYNDGGYIGLGVGTTITASGQDSDAMLFQTALYTNSTLIPYVYSGITMSSARGYLIRNITGEDLNIAFSGASELYGDLYNAANLGGNFGTITLYLSDTSFFQGESRNTPSQTGAMVNLDLSGNGYWHVADDYKIDNITMAGNGRILFDHDDLFPSTFYNAKVASITGTGIFELNVDMSGSGSGDLLSITDATGTYKLKLIDKTNGTGVADGLVVIEIANAPTGLNISLFDGSTQTLGGIQYALKSNANLTEWYLEIFSGPNPDIVDGTNTSMIGLFEFAKAVDASISDELLSAKKTVWVFAGYKLQNFRDLPTNDELKQSIFSLVVGMDVAKKDNWNFGALLGLSIGNQDVDGLIISTTDSFTLGFTATYSNNGLVASGYVRLANYMHSIEVVTDPSLMQGRMNTFGISASVQAIKNFYIADTGIFVAPKAKLSFTHIFGFEHDFDYFTVTGKPASALVAWAGGRIGYDLSIRDIPVTPYVEAGFMYDTNPKITVFVDGDEEEMNISGIRYEVGLGFTIIPSEASSFTFEYKFASSKNLVEPIKIKISATTSF